MLEWRLRDDMAELDEDPRFDQDAGDVRLLRSFVAVVRHGGFSAAATELHLSQQAVSVHVGRLERQLGVELLNRTTRTQSLTPVGADFFHGARRVLIEIEELWDRTKSAAGSLAGEVRVGISPAAGNHVAPELMAAMASAAPNVRITMVEEQTPVLLRELASGALDLGLVLAPGRDHGLTGRMLLSGPMAVLISRAHPLARRERLSIEDVRDLTLVVPRRTGHAELHDVGIEFAARAGLTKTRESLVDSTLPDEVYDGVAYGLWPTVLPQRQVPGGVVTVPVDFEIGRVGIWLLRRRIRPTRAAAAVLDAARQLWPELPTPAA